MMQRVLVSTLVSLVMAQAAHCAETWPVRPIRLLVGFTPGGAADVSARVITRKMAESLGVNIVVENRPGAGGNIAAEIVATANPNGYTLYWSSVGPLTVSPALGIKLPYDPLKDFAPISMGVQSCNVLSVRPQFPANTLADVIALAKAKPRQLKYSTQGIASTGHLSGELLRSLTGIDIVQVPYKGGAEGVSALLSGEVELGFLSGPSIRAIGPGRIKTIAITCARRDTTMKEIPTFAEAGVPNFEATFWYGLLAPARTPAAVIWRLNREMISALADPTVIQQLETQGQIPAPTSPEAFAKTIRDELAKWKKVFAQAR
jgi:tripartite-type tricarboxylate transporter receptor subunit TctC